MAKCKYCGQWAGLLKDTHPGCVTEHNREEEARVAREAEEAAKVEQVRALLVSQSSKGTLDAALTPALDEAAGGDRDVLWKGTAAWFSSLVREPFPEGVPQEQVESAVRSLMDHYGFKGSDLPDNLWNKFVKVCACGDLDRGVLPERVKVGGNLPFNLEGGERVVWLFPGAEYFEDKAVRSLSRSYGGLSMRVLPGVYAHMGQSAPSSVSEGFFPIDTGLLALTDRAILFSGSHKALRIKYKDIVAFTRYDSGFAVCKSNQAARNQAFEVADDFPGFPFVMAEGLAKLRASSGK